MVEPDELNFSTRDCRSDDLVHMSYVMLCSEIAELNYDELELNYLLNIEFWLITGFVCWAFYL